jgi:hypothetical protein
MRGTDIARDATASAGCSCVCHRGGVVVHPAPCCTACPGCGIAVATGTSHLCLGRVHPSTLKSHGRALLQRMARYDLGFLASMVLVVTGLAFYSVPFPSNLVLLGAGILGTVVAVAAILRRDSRPGNQRNGRR